MGGRTGGIQSRRDDGQVEYRAEEMQFRSDAGQVGCRVIQSILKEKIQNYF